MKQPGDTERKSITSSISDSGCGCSSGSGLLETVRQVISGGSDLETHFEYDKNGNQTRVTDAQNRVTDYEYNVMNEMTKVIDPLLNETTYAYNKLGHLTKVVDADAHEVDYSYDHFGRMTKQEDEVGDVTYAYDHRGNMTQVTDGNGKTYTYAYTTRNRLTKMTDPIGKETRYYYDNIGRATKTAAGASGTIDPVEYFYSGTTGQMTRVKYTNDAHEDEVEYYYDLAGQMTRVDDWMGGVGNSDGHFFYYDVMGRVTKYRDFDHEAMNPKEMTYSYAANGQLTSTTDFNGFTTAYTYDARHRLSTVTVGGKTWTYAYNTYNMPTSVTMPNGIVTEYVYDDVGRMTKIEHKDGATVLRGWTKTLGNDGGITRITEASGAYWDYDYDARHRLTEAWYRNANNLALWREKYTYDPGDNVLTKTTPFIEDFDDGNYAGWTNSGSWSAANGYMRNSVSGSWQAFWKTDSTADYEIRYSYYNEDTDASGSHGFLHARWLSAGPRLVINMMPGYVRLREYDGSSWTTRGTGWVTTEEATWYDVYAKLNGSNVEVWWGEKGGALSKIIDTSSVSLTTTERFRFEVAPAAQFRYDDIVIFSDGVKSTTTFTHNDANEQTAMTVDGTTTNFAYDAWGRMTSRTRGSLTANYAWRYGSFLANVTSDFPGEASEVDYVYDGLSNRRLKLVDGTDYTWTRYDANGRALADYSNGASYWEIGVRERSFHGGAEIEGSSPNSGTPSYYLRNHLGSIMATTDASKYIVASYQYTPYGEFLSESTSGDHATFGYTGHRLDRELNHYYAKFRYYNPTTMRWLSRDPLGMVDGPNVYAYVRGNPTFNKDLEGTITIIGAIAIGGLLFLLYKGGKAAITGDKVKCCLECLNDAIKTIRIAANKLEPLDFQMWYLNAKPGQECEDLCKNSLAEVMDFYFNTLPSHPRISQGDLPNRWPWVERHSW